MLMHDLHKLIDVVGKAGQLLKDRFVEQHFSKYSTVHSVDFRHKDSHELLADEDIISQDIIIDGIQELYQEMIIYSEECDNLNEMETDKNKKFIVDPLDGTHNYCFGNSAWGISLAYLDEENNPLCSIIFIPMLDVFMLSSKTSGSTILRYNGKESYSKTADCMKMKDVVICYDNQFYKLPPRSFEIYKELTKQCFTTRITGSAAYDASMVALGKVGARIWNSTNSYDISAALSIVRNAGGIACNFNGEDATVFDKEVIVCANKNIKEGILEIIKGIG